MIAIVDYGLGNVQAFANIYHRLGMAHCLASDADALESASHIILPGVGAFDHAMQSLNDSGMREVLNTLVLDEGRPVLGICVGMQMLATASDEGQLPGLAWVDGQVRELPRAWLGDHEPLPHMGWNAVHQTKDSPLFSNLAQNSRFYFLHGFYFDAAHKDNVIAESTYGENFPSVVAYNHIYGVQCHPEKSHQAGIQLLKNFGELAC